MQVWGRVLGLTSVAVVFAGIAAQAQMIDNTQAPNTAKAGINKSLQDEIGAGRGDVNTVGSSIYLINRDPFRSVRRGRQLFQRKFTRLQGQGAAMVGRLSAGLAECQREQTRAQQYQTGRRQRATAATASSMAVSPLTTSSERPAVPGVSSRASSTEATSSRGI